MKQELTMMYKLIMIIIKSSIMIGRNITFVLGIILLTLSGCQLFAWDEIEDYFYDIQIKNLTNDTLLLSLNKGGFTSDIDSKIIRLILKIALVLGGQV